MPQTLQATWDTNLLQLQDLTSIFYPSGWQLQYRTNSGWSSVAPSDATTISGLLASGTIISAGVDKGSNQATYQRIQGTNQVVVPAIPGTFAIPTQGDGWNVFFDPQNTRVFNVYHHSSPPKIDCHRRADGSTCNGWPRGGVWVPAGNTNNRATGEVLADGRIFIPGANGSYGGFSCLTVDGTACPTSFYALTNGSGRYVQDAVTDVVYANRKLYTLDTVTSQLLCFSPVSNTACPSENRWVPPNTNRNATFDNNFYSVRLIGDSTRLFGYFAHNNGTSSLFCYDTTTKRSCVGWDTGKAVAFVPALLVPISRNGTEIESVCAYIPGSQACYNTVGKATPMSSALLAALNATASDYSPLYGNTAMYQGKTYWSGSWVSGVIGCYDATSDTNCWASPVFQIPSREAYTVRPDPILPNCLWTNSDSHGIKTYTVSGRYPSENCGGIPPTTSFTANASNVRLGCPANHPISAWKAYQISGASGATSASLTVFDTNGKSIPQWSNVPAGNGDQGSKLTNGSATWDLTTLSLEQTGHNPRFQVVIPGTTVGATVSVSLLVVGKTAELCWSALNLGPADPGAPGGKVNDRPPKIAGTAMVTTINDQTGTVEKTTNGTLIYTIPGALNTRRRTWARLR